MKYLCVITNLGSLSLLLSLCLLAKVGFAQPPENTTFITKGTEAHPVALLESLGWLIADHENGITWLKDADSQATNPQFRGHIATLDWRFIDAQTRHILIAAIDSETSAIHLVSFDTVAEKFVHLHSYKPYLADTEALCLGTVDNATTLYYINALGQAKHFIVDIGNTTTPTKLVPVRDLNVGENIKDCAIDDTSETLFLVEEEIGIWQYDARAEGQLERSLIPFNESLEVESISAIGHKHVVAVSADVNKIIVYGPLNNAKNSSRVVVKQEYTTTAPFDTVNGFFLEQQNSQQTAAQHIVLGAYSEASDELRMMTFDATELDNVAGTNERKNEKPSNIVSFVAKAETKPVARFGDAADDPAIWFNQQNPDNSLIYGTDKKSGLNVYKLNGELVQSLNVGRINNIDIRKGHMIDGRMVDIAVASNRTHKSMTVFEISPNTGKAKYLGDIKTDLQDVYGICLYQYKNDIDVIINDTSGTFNRYRLDLSNVSSLAANKISTFSTQTQPEGCIADDETGRLFYGEEAVGVWLTSLIDDSFTPSLIAKAESPLQADIEGMGIYKLANESFLVVSSQGNNRFAVYRVDANNELLGVFKIDPNMLAGIDAVSETDGLEVTSVDLGKQFPKGLLVVQDGHNVMPLQPQNFKLVSGEYLHNFIVEKLKQ